MLPPGLGPARGPPSRDASLLRLAPESGPAGIRGSPLLRRSCRQRRRELEWSSIPSRPGVQLVRPEAPAPGAGRRRARAPSAAGECDGRPGTIPSARARARSSPRGLEDAVEVGQLAADTSANLLPEVEHPFADDAVVDEQPVLAPRDDARPEQDAEVLR